MEGLIPMLFHALKKQRPHNSFRCFSEGSISNRSYHRLIGPQDSVDGSSHHCRTRSKFQPSTVDHFQDQRSGEEVLDSMKVSLAVSEDVSGEMASDLYTVKSGYRAAVQEHLLFSCNWVRAVWFGCNVQLNGGNGPPNSVIKWTSQLVDDFQSEDLNCFLSRVSRNEYVFNSDPINPEKTVRRVLEALKVSRERSGQEFSRLTSFNKLGSGLAPGFTGNGLRQIGSNAYQGIGANLRRR
ncbi:hypothetical protein RHSIM_Rhsim11G0153200 [Rhododendron simsii]|uniref:Uncharacterized protein n=1 Tax=Rhododendron simsii TaxID=118357 RepID=A0A834GC42_RHOSS|nr:hypothetical protein RHSIM_Rhsim11G0153200 [Rhododendron simsii]